MDDGQAIDLIAEHLESYLASRPDAADTLRGILEWWFVESSLTPPSKLLHQALLRLEAAGRVHRDRLVDGTEIWRGKPRRS